MTRTELGQLNIVNSLLERLHYETIHALADNHGRHTIMHTRLTTEECDALVRAARIGQGELYKTMPQYKPPQEKDISSI